MELDTGAFGLTPLAGGFSGETFLADAAGERTVVRVYGHRGAVRGPAAVEVDAAVLRLVRGLLPVPEVLEVRRPDPGADTPGVLVTGFLPGHRLDTVLPDADDQTRARTGGDIGRIIGRLAQMPMPEAGMFVDGRLTVEPWPGALDLVAWTEQHREAGGLARWPPTLHDGLLDVAGHAQGLLDEVGRCCLVHSDLNPKNLLVDGEGRVTGLLDWEFAHAGHPSTDLGNLLRFEREPVFVEAVVDGYLSVAGHLDGLPELGRQRLVERARAADLLALVELAGRRETNPVTECADQLLRAIARDGDLTAVPPSLPPSGESAAAPA
jgi:aminoglycoside phosphotransferase (APT) family kinase protein